MSVTTQSAGEARALLEDRLKHRQLVMLPIDGDTAAPTTGVQGRQPGTSTAPAELAELISSIASVGLLQPILVEDLGGRHRVVAGERRLRAMRWGRAHLADNPHFREAPALVVPGPLSEEECRAWQLVENLARDDLQPAELGHALMLERSAVLAERLTEAGVTVPAEVWAVEDPVRRWSVLDRVRRDAGAHGLGAPWDVVLSRVGIQLGTDKARQIVRAFATLPREVSTEMDAAGVALATRLEYLRLDRGRRDAAEAIWAAVRARGAPRLLRGAVQAALDDPRLDAEEAVQAAGELQQAADEARRRANSAADDDAPTVEESVVAGCVEAMDRLLEQLRGGAVVAGYTGGTIVLHARELVRRLQ